MAEAAMERRVLRRRLKPREESSAPSSVRGPEALFSGLGEVAERARGRKAAAAELRSAQRERAIAEGPSVSEMKSDPLALAAAIRRHQVKRIAPVANPLSPDTEHVFTAGGARYAKTGVYVPTIGERAAGVRAATRAKGEEWWEKNKKTVVVAALSVTAGFLLYSAWKNAQLRKQLEASRRYAPPSMPMHRTGYYYGYEPEEGEWQSAWEGEAW